MRRRRTAGWRGTEERACLATTWGDAPFAFERRNSGTKAAHSLCLRLTRSAMNLSRADAGQLAVSAAGGPAVHAQLEPALLDFAQAKGWRRKKDGRGVWCGRQRRRRGEQPSHLRFAYCTGVSGFRCALRLNLDKLLRHPGAQL